MHIGVVTYHNKYNYGAVLQAYALCHTLRVLGHKPTIIDFRLSKGEKRKELVGHLKSLKMRLGEFYNLVPYRKRNAKFKIFGKKHLPLGSSTYFTFDEIRKHPPRMQAYITGSDQVWNTDICGSDIVVYLLEFVNAQALKISYAASFGRDAIKDNYKELFARSLVAFTSISVREDHGKELVKACCGKDAEVVVDPVFLVDKKRWREVRSGWKHSKPYIFLYTLHKDKLLLESAIELAGKTGFDLVHLPLYSWNTIRLPGVTRVVRDAGPEEFISMLLNAHYVCTDSFHGTSFSVIFGKPFLTSLNRPRNGRMVHLLKMLQLTDHGVKNRQDSECLINRNLHFNVEKAEELLLMHRDRAIAFLSNALSETAVGKI